MISHTGHPAASRYGTWEHATPWWVSFIVNEKPFPGCISTHDMPKLRSGAFGQPHHVPGKPSINRFWGSETPWCMFCLCHWSAVSRNKCLSHRNRSSSLQCFFSFLCTDTFANCVFWRNDTRVWISSFAVTLSCEHKYILLPPPPAYPYREGLVGLYEIVGYASCGTCYFSVTHVGHITVEGQTKRVHS